MKLRYFVSMSICGIFFIQTSPIKAQCDPPTNILIDDSTVNEDYLWPRIIDNINLDDVAWDFAPVDDDDEDELKNNGIVVVGETDNDDPDNIDAFIIRFDEDGNEIWRIDTIGGGSVDIAYAVEQASDNNLIICGKKKSNTYGNPSNLNAWYIKVQLSDGLLLEQFEYGGLGDDVAWDIIEDRNTDPIQYVIVGGTGDTATGTLIDFDDPGINGTGEAWVFTIDPDDPEEPIWQNIYNGGNLDGSESDWARSIIIDHNGKYLVSGYCLSCYSDKTQMQAMLLKIKNDGTETFWQNDYGDEEDNDRDQGSNAAIEVYNAGNSTYGYVGTGIHHPDSNECFEANWQDWYGYKTTNTGVNVWTGGCQLTDGLNYGGKKNDNAYSVIQACDGDYIIVGTTESKDFDVECNHDPTTSPYTFDAWMIKIDDTTGNIVWVESLGDVFDDEFHSIRQLEDGAIITVGTLGTDIDEELQNFYVVKFELSYCAPPTNLTATNGEDPCTIKFQWDGTSCAQSYVLRYKKTGTSNWVTESVDSTDFTTDPVEEGDYTWGVRAKCSPNVTSSLVLASSDFTACTKMGLERRSGDKLVVYPNPSNGSFRISFTCSSEINLGTTINIKDCTGRIVERVPVKIEEGLLDFKHSLGDFPPGFYFIHLVVKGIAYQEKLIIQMT